MHRRSDAISYQLRATSHIQEHLAAQIHRFVGGIEQHLSDLFPNCRATRLAHRTYLKAALLGIPAETAKLCAFAASIWPIEDDESASQLFQPSQHVNEDTRIADPFDCS